MSSPIVSTHRPNRDRPKVVAERLRALERMLAADVDVATSLRGVGQSTGDWRLVRAADFVTHGMPLTQALAQEGAFPVLVLMMLEAGEEQGDLLDAVSRAAEQCECQVKLDRAVREATLYPKLAAAALAAGLVGLTVVARKLGERAGADGC